jgi:hypothetical protein
LGNTVELIKKYFKPIYVETGCACGDGILRAQEAGCNEIHGLDVNGSYVNQCKKRSGIEDTLLVGKAENLLPSIMRKLKGKEAIIFLDAHKVSNEGNQTLPLIKELSIIWGSGQKNHTIMIDDVRLFGGELKVSREKVVAMLSIINSNYNIVTEDSNTNKGDVLVAYL